MFEYFPPNRFQKCNRVLLGLFLFSLALGSFHCAVPETQAAVQVTLAWDPNNEPDLAGYKVYYGTSTKDYGVSYDAGNVNSYTIDHHIGPRSYRWTAVGVLGLALGHSSQPVEARLR